MEGKTSIQRPSFIDKNLPIAQLAKLYNSGLKGIFYRNVANLPNSIRTAMFKKYVFSDRNSCSLKCFASLTKMANLRVSEQRDFFTKMCFSEHNPVFEKGNIFPAQNSLPHKKKVFLLWLFKQTGAEENILKLAE